MSIEQAPYQFFPSLIPVGYVQKTIGFSGQIQIQLDCPIRENTSHPAFFWFMQDGKPVPFHVEAYDSSAGDKIKIQLEDIPTEQEAQIFKGLKCFIEETQYDLFYEALESYDYLLGFEVIDKEHGALGKVQDVLENDNGHDNLVVLKGQKEIMIPFVAPIVTKVDEEHQKIQVELPEGLLELYLN